MKNYIYIQGFGFVRKETKSGFKKKKMKHADSFFGGWITPSQETDLN
jgi:hypothetical protein